MGSVTNRTGARAVDLGGPSIYQEGGQSLKLSKSRCLQKRKFVNWDGQAYQLGGPCPPLALALVPGVMKSVTVLPTAGHRSDVSSKLCYPGAKSRRWAPPLVPRFGVIPPVGYHEDLNFTNTGTKFFLGRLRGAI